MKRIFLLALLAMLLLSGCSSNDADETIQTTAASTVPTEAPGWYTEDSEIEKKTEGAVQLFSLDGTYSELMSLEDRLLLADRYGATYLNTLDITSGKPLDNLRIGRDIGLGTGGLQRTYNGLGYYVPEKHQAVILNAQLQQIQTIDLPSDLNGAPVFGVEGNELYYSTGNEIYGFDMNAGITRLVKTLTYPEHTLLGCYFDGQLLACSVTDQLGDTYTIYISTQNGQTLMEDDGLHTLYTMDNLYLGLRQDGVVAQYILGERETEPVQLNLVIQEQVAPALALNGAVGFQLDADGVLQLALYDITSGKKSASVGLPGLKMPDAICADKTGVWLLAVDDVTNTQSLYRWCVDKSLTDEDQVYTTAVYTADAPDALGLNQCQNRAGAIGNKHGVDIRIWEKAIRNPGEYTLKAEYQTTAINDCLDALDEALEVFPDNFLYRSVKNQIHICIVRSISGDLAGTQYWHNGDAYVLMTPGADVLSELSRGVGYIVNSHVMGNSPVLDSWSSLNPAGFEYGTADESYLNGENRAFADAQSMESVTDDRSHLFLYALSEDNEELFQSKIMQAKLLMLCQGIRDAWRWEKKTDIFPWEQYLMEPIAYKK